jgi:hypothetical protein
MLNNTIDETSSASIPISVGAVIQEVSCNQACMAEAFLEAVLLFICEDKNI